MDAIHDGVNLYTHGVNISALKIQTVVSATGATQNHSCAPRVNSQDGMTIIMLASKYNKKNPANLVLAHKADINKENEIKPVRQVTYCIRFTHDVAYMACDSQVVFFFAFVYFFHAGGCVNGSHDCCSTWTL